MPTKSLRRKSGKKTKPIVRSGHSLLDQPLRFSFAQLAVIIAVLALFGTALAYMTRAAAVTPVTCSTATKHECNFYTTVPIKNSSNVTVGTMAPGNSWVLCQMGGARVTIGSNTNVWWAYTESDQLNWGWANAVYATTGSDDGYYGGNTPYCNPNTKYNGSTAAGYPPGFNASYKLPKSSSGSSGGGINDTFGSTATENSWMHSAGIATSNYGYVSYIVSHESGWCATRLQGYYGSCLSAAPSSIPENMYTGYGVCQSTPANKMASVGSDWRTNPVTQLKWCNAYAVSAYSSWAGAANFWYYHHWW
jgi:hypothetical protein